MFSYRDLFYHYKSVVLFIQGLENLTVGSFSQLLAQFNILEHLAFGGALYIGLILIVYLFRNGGAATLKYPSTVKIATGRNVVHDHH